MSVVSGAVGIVAYLYAFWILLNFYIWIVDIPFPEEIKQYFLYRKIDVGVVELDLQRAALKNLWILTSFGISHVVFARPGFKQFLEKYFYGKKFERSMFLVQAAVLLHVLMLYWSPLPLLYSYKDQRMALILQVILPTIGFFILFLSSFHIDHFELFGLKQAMEIEIPKASFATMGFYKFVRHPIMTGMLLLMTPNAFKSYGRLLLAVMMDVFILIAVYKFEEPELVRVLGDKYSNYQKTTPAFIPFSKFAWGKTVGSKKKN